MPTEEIFDKEIDKVVKKPKRKLTEKQLENLAKGREKMRLKREADKLKKEKGIVKEADKGAKQDQKEQKKALKVKRKTMKEINIEKQKNILEKLEKAEKKKSAKREEREALYHTLKLKCLEKAKSVKEYTEIQTALDGIDEDILHDDEKLKDYAKEIMKPYILETTE